MAAGRHGLARIPIQIATNVDNIKSIHRHFFSGATYEDHKKFGLVAPDDGNNPSSFWFCRVPDCNHREKKGGSTRQRLGHLRVNHLDMVMELVRFRQHQGEPHEAALEMWGKHASQPSAAGRQGEALSDAEKKDFTRAIAEGIALSNHPFSNLESGLVRNIVRFFNPSCIVPSVAAIEYALDEEYYALMLKAKRILQNNVTLGSYTADTWTIKIFDEWELQENVLNGTTGQEAKIKCATRLLQVDTGYGWNPCSAHNIQLCVDTAISNTEDVHALLDKCSDLSSAFRNTSEYQQPLTEISEIN
ncbi:hypothetical protein BGZ58_000452 [Dissophora ornata]|nr:hypothetical protein BGZ58_000452 [Dissophora ornata]